MARSKVALSVAAPSGSKSGGWGQRALERLAATALLAAGVIGGGGYIGAALAWFVGGVQSLAVQMGGPAVGGDVLWVVCVFLLGWWLGAMLPDSWTPWRMPDWLSVLGLVLPGFAAAIPGALGQWVQLSLDALATAVRGLVT